MIGDGVNNRATKDTSRPLERLALTVVISGPRSFWPSAVIGPTSGTPWVVFGPATVLGVPFSGSSRAWAVRSPTVVYFSSFRASYGAVALILFAIWSSPLSVLSPFGWHA